MKNHEVITKKTLNGERGAQATSSQSSDYMVGSVSGSLFLKEASSSSRSLAALFSSAPPAKALIYVRAVKPAPKSKQEDMVDAEVKGPSNQQKKKATKRKSAADQKVENRESALQNADADENVTKTPMKVKRKVLDVRQEGSMEEEMEKKRPTQRQKTERVEERIKLKRTVFVGNLPVSCTKKTLKIIFKDKGLIETIRFRSLVREDPGMSRKCATIQRKVHCQKTSINAYVVFKDEEGAVQALERNGMEIEKGFHIRVDKVSQNSLHDHKRSIFVGNLPFEINELPLRQHFDECGTVEGVRLVRDVNSGMGKGFGYVLFESADSVQLALKLNGSKLQDRSIRVKRSVPKDKAIKMASKKGPRGRRDKGHNKETEGRETMVRVKDKGTSKVEFKRRPRQGPQDQSMGKPFIKSPNKYQNTSSESFKGEMTDPTKKPKKKGLKKKLRPRRSQKTVHI
ncbi:RNA-binding protein 34 isoform X2 [Hypomesus transpacificus]|uniref:RNA-binding protein 34 isoform X2 n=1 Tax=Hypomesus transpacificus TaxID=137520 RepID=UPI001F07FFD5|nr:RNA-binding protein 34 isoform X2 [Hypomesus transpacificus]